MPIGYDLEEEFERLWSSFVRGAKMFDANQAPSQEVHDFLKVRYINNLEEILSQGNPGDVADDLSECRKCIRDLGIVSAGVVGTNGEITPTACKTAELIVQTLQGIRETGGRLCRG